MSRLIGADLGTANTYIYRKSRGIVLKAPSAIAIDTKKKTVVSLGKEALVYEGKNADDIVTFRPIKDGVIADFDITLAMLERYFENASGKGNVNRPNVIISVPHGITEVEKRAIEEASLEAGARSVAMVEASMAAALGAELPIDEPRGSMIVNIGEGTTETAVISLGGTVFASSCRVAGEKLTEAVSSYLKRRYNLIISNDLAEKVKINIGTLSNKCDRGTMKLDGRDAVNGLPLQTEISSLELIEPLTEQFEPILDCIKKPFENLAPELCSDIFEHGITFSGGSALLGGLKEHLESKLGFVIHIADKPDECVVSGLGKIIEICPEIVEFKE